MYWVLLEAEAEEDPRLLQEFYGTVSDNLLSRFTKAIAVHFGTLENFPLAFPVIKEISGVPIRRALIRGFPQALLYTVLEDVSEVRILRRYDTPNAGSKLL